MQKALKVRLQKLDTNSYTDIFPEIYDYYLNCAYLKIIKKYAYPDDDRKKGFEQSSKRFEDLRGLVIPATIQPQAGVGYDPNGTLYLLPSDYMFPAREKIQVKGITNKGIKFTKWNTCIPATQDRLNKIIDDPFKAPNEDENIRVTYASYNEIIANSETSLHDYFLVYIKKPKYLIYDITQFADSIFNINGNLTINNFVDKPEVAEELHIEIVELAETLLVENIQSPRFETNFQELIK